MKPALGQVCSLHSPFDVDVAEYAAGKCPAIDVWLTKLEAYLQSHSIPAARALLESHEVAAPVASFQGGLLASQGAARQEAWDLFARRLELCRQMEIGTLVVACDVAAVATPQDVERVRASLALVAREAARYGRRAALEFQATAALGNNLQTAAGLVGEVGSPHLGLCLDAFHYFVGPSQAEDLNCLTRDNLFHVQVCDLADVPRELATDADRILPGDGDIPLAAIIARLREIGYQEYVALELLNPQLWQIAPRQLGEVGMTALRTLLGQADMGG